MTNQAGFITPDNEKIVLPYGEIGAFCRILCENEENLEKFQVFSKDYTYFDPYFDFVMFELHYVFFNALCEENHFLISLGDALYSVDSHYCGDFDYSSISSVNRLQCYPISTITRCSDTELCVKALKREIPSCMISNTGDFFMSRSGIADDERGSHHVTCSTILNQLLIQDQSLVEEYLQFGNKSISFLLKLGYVRALSKEYGGDLFYDSDSISFKLKEKLESLKGHSLCDVKQSQQVDRRR